MAGVSSGPTPWWQTAGNEGKVNNLQASAPSGYEYDPVTMGYRRTPTSAGQRVNQFSGAAYPGLSGAIGGLNSAAGASGAPGAPGLGAPGVGGTGAGAGPVSSGGYVAPVAAPNTTAATDAAYASAKDKTGNAARGALTSLRDEMGAAGMSGSGAEAQGTRDVINAGQSQLGEAARGEAETSANLSADFAKTGYQGSIAQRGQDINAQEANARLALEQRQQYMSLLQSALGGLTKAGGGESLLY